MGRKKIIIDWNRIEKMAISGANGRQISASIGIHYNTLVNKCKAEKKCDFSDFLQTKKQKGNQLLNAKQFDLAMKGDRAMLIWLGKQRLDQSDKKEIKQENTGQLLNIPFTSTGVKPIRNENDVVE